MSLLHRLVTTQLAKSTLPCGTVDCELLCRLMSTCYQELERDRKRVDRANKLMQAELEQLTGDLERIVEELRVQNLHFQAALDNMSQGLCLLDATGHLIVTNRRFLQMYRLSANAGAPGRPMAEILGDSAILSDPQAYLGLSGSRSAGTLCQELKDGRIVQIAHEPLEGGGSVDTFADITEQTRADTELAQAHKQLVEISRQAGMAEVATGVLHNVGNVLNSVNVSATLLAECIGSSKAGSLGRVVSVLREHEAALGEFVTSHPQGRHLLSFLDNLDRQLGSERQQSVQELDSLRKNIDHIKDIVAMQQSFAVVGGVQEQVRVSDLVEDGLRMSVASLNKHRVEIVRDYGDTSTINVDKHKALQILVNLISNAKHACVESGKPDTRLTVQTALWGERVKISVADNGVGIAQENLTRIFNHGFTTRKTGHGFGLHSAALAARELNGSLTVHSEGAGCGATFTLELPLQSARRSEEREAVHA